MQPTQATGGSASAPGRTAHGLGRPPTRPSLRCCPARWGAPAARRLPPPCRGCHRRCHWRAWGATARCCRARTPLWASPAQRQGQEKRQDGRPIGHSTSGGSGPAQSAAYDVWRPSHVIETGAHHPGLLVIGEGVGLACAQPAAAQVTHHDIHGWPACPAETTRPAFNAGRPAGPAQRQGQHCGRGWPSFDCGAMMH